MTIGRAPSSSSVANRNKVCSICLLSFRPKSNRMRQMLFSGRNKGIIKYISTKNMEKSERTGLQEQKQPETKRLSIKTSLTRSNNPWSFFGNEIKSYKLSKRKFFLSVKLLLFAGNTNKRNPKERPGEEMVKHTHPLSHHRSLSCTG